MNNANMPAMPIEVSGSLQYGPKAFTGMTKREDIAKAAMQGLLVNMGRNGFITVNRIADEAVKAADALLAELERTK